MIEASIRAKLSTNRSCLLFWILGLMLSGSSRQCTGFIARSPLSVRRAIPEHFSPCVTRRNTNPHERKRDFWRKFFGRDRKKPKRLSRSSSYLATMDKRRGYHRKSLGGLAQVANNTHISIMSPERVAGAIVGKISSTAFK